MASLNTPQSKPVPAYADRSARRRCGFPRFCSLFTCSGSVVVHGVATFAAPSPVNSKSGFGQRRAKLFAMRVPELSKTSRWQPPNPSFQRTASGSR
jgi:hypothetical protein